MLALTGHAMLARWHLGPISGFHFWWVLVTSPEVLVFLFFMITDPKTAPRSPSARLVYAVSLGLLGALLIAPTTTEFASKVALLGALAIVCAALPLLRRARVPLDRRIVLAASSVAIAAFALTVAFSGNSVGASAFRPLPPGALPPITILPSRGVQTQLDRHTAELIAHDLVAVVHASASDRLTVKLAPGGDQGPPFAIAQIGGKTYQLAQGGNHWLLQGKGARPSSPAKLPSTPVLAANRLTNVAGAVGLDFRQDSFRYGVSNEYQAMMGGGVCWLDYNGDGWLDLFAVNSYSSADRARWEAAGGLPQAALFENVHGRFRNVSGAAHAGLRVQGDGCVAADLNGDGRPDLVVTTTNGVDLLWNDGDGTFTEGARAAGMTASGWYAGAAVADVNGDGRPDVFVAGYTDPNDPVANSLSGFPTNLAAVRDLLYLNEGNGPNGRARFREVGVAAGLESAVPRHGLGAVFTDYNGDGRPDLYVANDEDPNQLYENVPWPGGAKADPAGLGFRLEERAAAAGVADPYAGMGIAAGVGADGRYGLFVTNSRQERSGAFSRSTGTGAQGFADARQNFDPALGTGFAGWGVSWVDLANSGSPDLVLAAGAIPVTNLARDAEPVRVLGPVAGGKAFGNATGILGRGGLRLDGRGLAAADANNDGRMDVAVNTIGGRLVLLRADRAERSLAGREAVEVLARRRRDRGAAGRAAADTRDPGGQQLPLVRGSTRPLRPRRGDHGQPADGALPVGRREPVDRPPGEPHRRRPGAGACARTYDGAEHGPADVPARRLLRAGPARTIRGARVERGRRRRAPVGSTPPRLCRRATSSTSPRRCGMRGPPTTRTHAGTS